MQPEPENINLTIGGGTYLFNTPVDGIALSPDKTLLHYCALGRIPELRFFEIYKVGIVGIFVPSNRNNCQPNQFSCRLKHFKARAELKLLMCALRLM